MTVREAINTIDGLKANQYTEENKLAWLETIEHRIYNEILLPCEGTDEPFGGIADNGIELSAPGGYENVYIFWLEAQIDYWNGEISRYNNSAQRFQQEFDSYRDYWTRHHKPKSKRWKLL